MWLGTPDAMVAAMLKAARTGPADFVADLGAGDGRIAIAAARDFGARALGIEYDPKMAALAARNAARAGVGDRVRIVEGDIFKEDFSRASVVTLYLLPELNLQLRPTILAMAPGTRVASHQFTMAEWEPDQLIRGPTWDAYLWIVPATVAGRWRVADESGRDVATVELAQQFQKVGGTIAVAGTPQPVLGASLAGRELCFVRRSRRRLRAVRLTSTAIARRASRACASTPSDGPRGEAEAPATRCSSDRHPAEHQHPRVAQRQCERPDRGMEALKPRPLGVGSDEETWRRGARSLGVAPSACTVEPR
jgi:hypothetical protein